MSSTVLINSMGSEIKEFDSTNLCDVCNLMFDTEENLQIHKAKHSRRLYCAICGQQFSRKFNLLRHEKKHGKNPELKCDFEGCAAVFHTKYNLARHKRIHLKIRHTEPCPFCGIFVQRADNLKRHVLKCPRQ